MVGMNIAMQGPVGPALPVKVSDRRQAIPVDLGGAGRAIPFRKQAHDRGIAIDPASVRTKAGRSTRGTGGDVEFPKLFELANRIVGRLFYGTLLASVRQSSLKGKLMHGGRGEDVFGAQLDSKYAEQLGLSMKRGLGHVLYKRLAGQETRLNRSRATGPETNAAEVGAKANGVRTGRASDAEGRLRTDDANRFESIA